MANYRSDIDPYGFERPDSFDYDTFEEFMSDYLRVLAKRAAKWEHLLKNTSTLHKSRKVKRYIRKGIPSEHRAETWLTMSGAKKWMASNKLLFATLLAEANNPADYDVIEKDIRRTFPENIYFKEVTNSQLKSLRNVLVAYAHHDKETGYCQGLNYIVGMLLLVTNNEEHSFCILAQLLQAKLPNFYAGRLHGLRVECAVLTELIRQRHEDLYDLFRKHNVDLDFTVSKWFICLFVDVLPVETVLRIWDCLIYEGSKILLRVALTLILQNKELFMNCKDFTEIFTVFKQITQASSTLKCHEFMQAIFTVPGSLPMATVTAVRDQCREVLEAEASNKTK